MVVFAFILFTYFLVTGGIVYDVIVEPLSIGSTTDEKTKTAVIVFTLCLHSRRACNLVTYISAANVPTTHSHVAHARLILGMWQCRRDTPQ